MTRFRFLLAALALGFAGCGGPPSLSGTVTLDGKPLPGAAVIFFPDEGNDAETVVGSTDQSGQFVITPAAGTSVAYGKYKVVVSKRKDPTPEQINAMMTPEEILPPKYSDLAKSELRVEVNSSDSVDLKLTK